MLCCYESAYMYSQITVAAQCIKYNEISYKEAIQINSCQTTDQTLLVDLHP